eukprot:TRINITY_DN48820_c0_g1_i1.p1 TRINITY_DN48820_c0_g1~~TRINITY_DN48820_c0_g1_i1.p1  ORF type:complete len:420 (-),score=72.86 TRINITY_DN48820_c0_g1_i1:96-1313(-)
MSGHSRGILPPPPPPMPSSVGHFGQQHYVEAAYAGQHHPAMYAASAVGGVPGDASIHGAWDALARSGGDAALAAALAASLPPATSAPAAAAPTAAYGRTTAHHDWLSYAPPAPAAPPPAHVPAAFGYQPMPAPPQAPPSVTALQELDNALGPQRPAPAGDAAGAADVALAAEDFEADEGFLELRVRMLLARQGLGTTERPEFMRIRTVRANEVDEAKPATLPESVVEAARAARNRAESTASGASGTGKAGGRGRGGSGGGSASTSTASSRGGAGRGGAAPQHGQRPAAAPAAAPPAPAANSAGAYLLNLVKDGKGAAQPPSPSGDSGAGLSILRQVQGGSPGDREAGSEILRQLQGGAPAARGGGGKDGAHLLRQLQPEWHGNWAPHNSHRGGRAPRNSYGKGGK